MSFQIISSESIKKEPCQGPLLVVVVSLFAPPEHRYYIIIIIIIIIMVHKKKQTSQLNHANTGYFKLRIVLVHRANCQHILKLHDETARCQMFIINQS